MADINIELAIEQIRNQYPWALDQTMEQIGYTVGADVKNTLKALQAKGKHNDELENITKQFLDNTKELSTTQKSVIGATDGVKDFMSSTDPLKGTIKLLTDFSPMIMVMGQGMVVKMAPGAGVMSKAILKGMETMSVVGGAVAGILYVYADLLTEHVKSARVMIDYGLAVGNLNTYTEMRDSFGEVGMSLNEGMNAVKSYLPAFANLKGPISDNLLAMTKLAHTIGSSDLDFGTSSSYVADKLNTEATILRKYLQLESLNQESQKRLIRRYTESSTRHVVLAELLGTNVTNWENDRQEANDDANFQQSMVTRASYLTATFGQEATDNILAFNDQSYSLFKNVLGSGFATDTQEAFNKSIFGIEHGATVTSSLSESLNTTLIMLGDDVRDSYISLLEDGRTGKLSGPELDIKLQQFVKLIADGDPIGYVSVIDPNVERARDIAARAKIAPRSYLDATSDKIMTLTNKVILASESADDSIDALDDLRISMRGVYNKLTPGFGKTQNALRAFTDGLNWSIGVLDKGGMAGKRMLTKAPYNDTDGNKVDTGELVNANVKPTEAVIDVPAAKVKGVNDHHYDGDVPKTSLIPPQDINTGNAGYTANVGDELISKDRGIQYQDIGHGAGYVEPIEDQHIEEIIATDNFMSTLPTIKDTIMSTDGLSMADSVDWSLIFHELELSKISLTATEKMAERITNLINQDELVDRPYVPIGEYSSARKQGHYGTIQAGDETNILDILGDRRVK